MNCTFSKEHHDVVESLSSRAKETSSRLESALRENKVLQAEQLNLQNTVDFLRNQLSTLGKKDNQRPEAGIICRLLMQGQSLQSQLELSKKSVSELKLKLKSKTSKCTTLKSKTKQSMPDYEENAQMGYCSSDVTIPESCGRKQNATAIVEHGRSIICCVTRRMRTDSTQCQFFFTELSKMMLDSTIHGGQLKKSAYSVFRQYVCKNIFSPPRILRHMDFHGGVLNYEALKALRNIETEGEPYVRTLIPSTAQMQQCSSIVKKFAIKFCPYIITHNKTEKAEGFHFR
ncbi:hypothetical protein ACA910_010511 [Epithemia clementina (nom. ined.)]